jgi:hypothetical protein
MKKKTKSLMKTIAIVTALLLPIPSLAGGFRCGGRLVSTGDTKTEVLAKCGEPETVDEAIVETGVVGRPKKGVTEPSQRKRTKVGTTSTRSIETWTYNFGPSQFMKILTFEGSVLKRIDDGDYGY